jgi:hypothetical protein
MTPAFYRKTALAIVAATLVAGQPLRSRSAWVADPAVLYRQMKDAYAKGTSDGWNFRAEETYLSTIFNAGRAYSLQYPNDPAYGELATLTVQVGTGLHYDPLTNHDGAVWWVREAADWVAKHAEDTTLISQAQALLQRANDEDDPDELARLADEDATANVRTYPGDVDALLVQVEADWRGWLLTGDPQWRSLALARAAAPSFPVAHLPTNWGNELINAANTLSQGDSSDAHDAAVLIARIKAVDPIRVIASVTAVPHDVYLSTLAPADEYFGKMEMSVLEIQNRLKHINFMLDYKYGNRESGETADVANSIDGMQKIYPRDRDLPMLLYWCITTAERMDDAQARAIARHLRAILTIEYQDSPQARKLLSGST